MMTSDMKKCFKRASKDNTFIALVKKDDPTFVMPWYFGDDITKSVVAAMYYGYVLGRDGEYNDG